MTPSTRRHISLFTLATLLIWIPSCTSWEPMQDTKSMSSYFQEIRVFTTSENIYHLLQYEVLEDGSIKGGGRTKKVEESDRAWTSYSGIIPASDIRSVSVLQERTGQTTVLTIAIGGLLLGGLIWAIVSSIHIDVDFGPLK